LWCNGMMKVGLGCLNGFVGKMKDTNIAGGGIDAIAFLAGEGYEWHAAAMPVLHALHGFVAFEPALARWLPIFHPC
jgi:hypothetical protein